MNTNKLGCVLASALLLLALRASAVVTVNEACYNGGAYPDENGNTPDWIELYNSGPAAVNLLNYKLTDNGQGSTWPASPTSPFATLPNYTLPPFGFLVIYADGTDSVTWTNAPDTVAIPLNATWLYFTGSAMPPGGAVWTGPAYNDTTWASGAAPLGYNDPKAHLDVVTVLPYGSASSRYNAAYFRKKFLVHSLGTVTGLLVRARLNDGAVIYLDGTEVHRFNMPGGAVAHGTFASADIPPTQWQTFTLPPVPPGEHLLAVEVHRATASVPDFTFDLSLTTLASGQVPLIHAPFALSAGEKVHLYNSSGVRLIKFNDNNLSHPSGSSLGMPTDGATVEGKEVVFTPPTPGAPNVTVPLPTYTVSDTVAPPAFSAAPGVYVGASRPVTLTAAVAGFRVYYTTDGSDPYTSATRAYVTSGASITLSPPPAAVDGIAWRRTNPVEVASTVSPYAGWDAPSGPVPRVVILRAVATNPSNPAAVYSAETHGTYLIGSTVNDGRTLPVVSLRADPDALFGFASGIYVPGKTYADSPVGYGSNRWGKNNANYFDGTEIPVSYEWFEPYPATARAAAQTLGMSIHGGGTRALPQKALYLLARNSEYGTRMVENTLFPDNPDLAGLAHKRFLLRASGNDQYGPDTGGIATMIKDATFHRIAAPLALSEMAYRPVTVYLNGVYWGIHNARESLDKHYFATRYNLDPDGVDILAHDETSNNKISIKRVEGDKNANNEFRDFLAHVRDYPPQNNPATYAAICNYLDITNYTDYIVAETFFANTDWPINNCDFWRATTNQTAQAGVFGDRRWRWMLYDLDRAGEMYGGTPGVQRNMIWFLQGTDTNATDEPAFLINRLWANDAYRAFFLERYARWLNTAFVPHRTQAVIADAAAAVAPHIEQHFRRWGRTWTQTQWQGAVADALISFTAQRYTNSWAHLDAAWPYGGTTDLAVRNADPAGTGGRFRVGDIDIVTATPGVTNRAAWAGRFFRAFPVAVEAIPDAGYVFDGWAGTALTAPSVELFLGDAPVTLTARFRPVGAPATPPTAYEAWALDNYSANDILATAAALPAAPSGIAGYANYAVFALGASRFETTPQQLAARAMLSIEHRPDGLRVSHFRTPAPYTLLSATSLVDAVWLPYTSLQTVTNPAAIEHRADPVLGTPVRFFKWSIPVP